MTPEEYVADLAARMTALAAELRAPLVCTQPGYGPFGVIHCAACCYGTGLVIGNAEDAACAYAADALDLAAKMIHPQVPA